MGLHCADCVYASFSVNEESGLYQGSCSRGYTLTNPHVRTSPEDHFAEAPEGLVPTVDPFGREYLRTSNVCERFLRPQDVAGRADGGERWYEHLHLPHHHAEGGTARK